MLFFSSLFSLVPMCEFAGLLTLSNRRRPYAAHMAERERGRRAWRDCAAQSQAESGDGVLDGHAADLGADAGRRGVVVDAVHECKSPASLLMMFPTDVMHIGQRRMEPAEVVHSA